METSTETTARTDSATVEARSSEAEARARVDVDAVEMYNAGGLRCRVVPVDVAERWASRALHAEAGWERSIIRAQVAEQERDEARGVRDELGAAYREAIGVPESQHQRARMERIASALEEAEAEIERLNNQVASVEALADEMAGQHGQCWNSLFARRIRAALGDSSVSECGPEPSER